jgi:hypothetical protein
MSSFRHLDLHELWVPNSFAIYTFRVIMYSIQVQYSYAVVEILMSHLDTSARSNARSRTSMANVLAKIISIAAGESVGKRKPSSEPFSRFREKM